MRDAVQVLVGHSELAGVQHCLRGATNRAPFEVSRGGVVWAGEALSFGRSLGIIAFPKLSPKVQEPTAAERFE